MKGWTVRTEATKNGSKGVASREMYLSNTKHRNHRNTERIQPIFGGDRTMSNISYAGESYAAKQKANGKGGRPPSSYAVEFTLNLPKGYRPDDKQWRKIVEHCLRETAKACGVEPNQIAPTSRAILHQQKQDGSKQGTGDHCHVVIGKFTQDGTYLRNLQRKTVTAKMKQSFNAAVKHYCGYDWTEYAKTLQEQKYPNKRPAPTWKVRAAKEREEIERQQAALDERAKFLVGKAKELEILESGIECKMNEIREIERLKNNFSNQAEKWLQAFKDVDSKQMNRQFNRMNKTIDDLGAFAMSDDDLAAINKLSEQINSRSPQQLQAIEPKRPSSSMRM
ncbi:hypothetical protein [Photobacterium leiognathi]|uniref:hypothetical protein n=1 Tax=Photobacterium leiognathi TaxID=553611 RepID=UPI0002088DDF|nr:hypothetical protein [Photobacterium leiognathi]PSW47839.1 hypothetical protein CTM83_20790 [Photobacterium leiognathi subsp. mandapamensis]GAA06973.1 putative uncharacterized protein [Photobacterium leiognathi subsp. mandapamensis svers.1.1.]